MGKVAQKVPELGGSGVAGLESKETVEAVRQGNGLVMVGQDPQGAQARGL